MTAPAEPEVSCNGTVFVYRVAPKDLAAAKRQVLRVAGSHPVIFLEAQLPDGQTELTVMAASLTPSKRAELQHLQQDNNLMRQIAAADFEGVQVRFGE